MKILKNLQKKKKERSEEGKNEEESKTESMESIDTMKICGEYFRTESIDNMMTSTPVRLNRLKKIIILHQVSHLKIYEDFDEIDNFDISAVTLYEEGDEEELSFDESGFKIYEDIGESFNHWEEDKR